MDSCRRRGGTTWCAVTICPQSVWTRADCPPACLLYALARLRSRLSRDDAHESSGLAIPAADQDCPNHRAGVNEGEETPGASGLAPSVVTEVGLLFLLRFLLHGHAFTSLQSASVGLASTNPASTFLVGKDLTGQTGECRDVSFDSGGNTFVIEFMNRGT